MLVDDLSTHASSNHSALPDPPSMSDPGDSNIEAPTETDAHPKPDGLLKEHPGEEDHGGATSGVKGFLTLRHYCGNTFMLPLAQCQTWEDMQERIKLSYKKDEERNQVANGKYTLYGQYGGELAIISRDHWEMVVVPKLNVIVKLDSQETSEEKSSASSEENDGSDDESVECQYIEEVKYTVDYYQQKKFSWEDDKFMWTVSFSNPLVLEKSNKKDPVLPVLEEKKTVAGKDKLLKNPKADKVPKLQLTDMVSEPSLHIHSPFLLNALRAIIKYNSNPPSGDMAEELKTGVFNYPYRDLFYHKQQLANFKQETAGPREHHTAKYNAECDSHIDILIDYLNQDKDVQLPTLEHNWSQKVPITTFAGLWLLMKPGEDVYVEEEGQFNAYVVHSVSGGTTNRAYSFDGSSTTAEDYDVTVWNLVYDGEAIRRMSKSIRVAVFDGVQDIKSLPIFPTQFHDRADEGKRRNELVQRGKKMFQYTKKPSFLEYSGTGLKPGWKKYNRARVVVEHESQPWRREDFNQLNAWKLDDRSESLGDRSRAARCECSQCADFNSASEMYLAPTFTEYDDIDPREKGELSDHQYLLCSSHMYGFILKDRTYDLLDVSGLDNPILAENAIERLVMRPETNKETIKAIVQTYGAKSGQSDAFRADFIHGKGEGQIFLLHGPPGTGKTLTAESVAEYTKRPLLSITAADLGHEPVELERNLLRFFKDAGRWDAIVLLDEADVYLERRSSSDLRRNSIVSIFLRALEYFQGILFLTTNRVGQFDEAFLSRIHLSIGYDCLNDDARGRIWDNLFLKLKNEHKHGGPRIQYDYDAKLYVKKSDNLKNLHWNGREIRNAFQTAVALAYYDADTARAKGASEEDCIPEVKEKHLMRVVSMSAAFKQYIKSTHEGVDDSDMAFRLGNRDDRFNPASKQ